MTALLQVSNCLRQAGRRLQGARTRPLIVPPLIPACRRHQSNVTDRSLTVRHVYSYFVRRHGTLSWRNDIVETMTPVADKSDTHTPTKPSCVADVNFTVWQTRHTRRR